MKSFSRLYVIIILLIIVASALSRAASAQSVCEGLATKLEALNSWNVEEEPEFYTLLKQRAKLTVEVTCATG